MAWSAVEDTGSVSMEDCDKCGTRRLFVIFRCWSPSSCARCSGEIMREQQKAKYNGGGFNVESIQGLRHKKQKPDPNWTVEARGNEFHSIEPFKERSNLTSTVRLEARGNGEFHSVEPFRERHEHVGLIRSTTLERATNHPK